ncbi:hypothetical protein SETIT_1G355900v2 [Setaria italica]|uniref:Uncharacterized protein n=1 Tax=Setaria italica TaxID=4555 RepID=A0A368PTH3_SETIT|nr:hypothetical protein SETIT_1G355900v2 [Setaria italica]
MNPFALPSLSLTNLFWHIKPAGECHSVNHGSKSSLDTVPHLQKVTLAGSSCLCACSGKLGTWFSIVLHVRCFICFVFHCVIVCGLELGSRRNMQCVVTAMAQCTFSGE